MKIHLTHTYADITSLENLTRAWREFIVGKKPKPDVQVFERNLMDHIIALHEDLIYHTYQHGGYYSFHITDPKPRHIHKASVRDRLLHHAIYRILYPFFDRTFIADSFSCRLNKGTHKAGLRFRKFATIVSKNNTVTCWVLKCDIRKFFASIDHEILLTILKEYISDQDIITLLSNIVGSFRTTSEYTVGLPLGNLTSQLLANVYMNHFDQWVKHKLKAKYYIRYADDFVILSQDKSWLKSIIPKIHEWLLENLKLTLHPNKIILKTFASGVDFLGWVHFPKHRVLRTTTKHHLLERIKQHATEETFQSYLGLLKHGNSYKIQQELKSQYWLWS